MGGNVTYTLKLVKVKTVVQYYDHLTVSQLELGCLIELSFFNIFEFINDKKWQ